MSRELQSMHEKVHGKMAEANDKFGEAYGVFEAAQKTLKKLYESIDLAKEDI